MHEEQSTPPREEQTRPVRTVQTPPPTVLKSEGPVRQKPVVQDGTPMFPEMFRHVEEIVCYNTKEVTPSVTVRNNASVFTKDLAKQDPTLEHVFTPTANAAVPWSFHRLGKNLWSQAAAAATNLSQAFMEVRSC